MTPTPLPGHEPETETLQRLSAMAPKRPPSIVVAVPNVVEAFYRNICEGIVEAIRSTGDGVRVWCTRGQEARLAEAAGLCMGSTRTALICVDPPPDTRPSVTEDVPPVVISRSGPSPLGPTLELDEADGVREGLATLAQHGAKDVRLVHWDWRPPSMHVWEACLATGLRIEAVPVTTMLNRLAAADDPGAACLAMDEILAAAVVDAAAVDAGPRIAAIVGGGEATASFGGPGPRILQDTGVLAQRAVAQARALGTLVLPQSQNVDDEMIDLTAARIHNGTPEQV